MDTPRCHSPGLCPSYIERHWAVSPVYSPFHGVGDEAGLQVCACSFLRLRRALWAMTEGKDLEWRGVLRLRQTSVKFSEAISY